MPQCPYQENIIDEESGDTISNVLYLVWHEGYEAHKLEMANKVKTLTALGQVLDNQVKQVTELQSELEVMKAELHEKLSRNI